MYLHSKTCPNCKTEKPLSEFYKNLSACRPCHWEYQKAYRLKNKEKRKEQDRRYKLKKHFGLSETEFNTLREEQNDVCAICFQPNKEEKSLCVDHCHSTGNIRGLLCSNCNLGIGQFFDDTDRLKAAIDYLKKHKEKAGITPA